MYSNPQPICKLIVFIIQGAIRQDEILIYRKIFRFFKVQIAFFFI